MASSIVKNAMDLHKIASRVARVARVETVGDSSVLTGLISDDIKARFKIPASAQPFKSGSFSSVFENSEGNIVAFIDTPNACSTAYKAVGRNLTTVPEVYDLDTFTVNKQKDNKPYISKSYGGWDVDICVIVMEKLTPISSEDYKAFDDLFLSYNQRNPKEEKEKLIKSLNGLEPTNFQKEVIDLLHRMDKENVHHVDFHPGNVAWGHDGKLKLIDWEPIFIGD